MADFTGQENIEIEFRSAGRPLPCRVDGHGMKVFKGQPGQEYDIVIFNRHGHKKYVVKAYIHTAEGAQPLLISADHHNFKPLFPKAKAIFKGFQVEYHKADFEGEETCHALQITRAEDSSHGKVEKISVAIFKNAGVDTYNRGGGLEFQKRNSSQLGGKITVPGQLSQNRFDCPPAAYRWESRQGKKLGVMTVGVESEAPFA
ncbi:unnamed protein product [Polarella glacialis]|uniref:Uncharacterized protein n=1 Tax=Polarella glacialis TaxID=89957 RepID=A0A813DCK7_POLGL|nr:unnamed protein product [Polarella glacialis]